VVQILTETFTIAVYRPFCVFPYISRKPSKSGSGKSTSWRCYSINRRENSRGLRQEKALGMLLRIELNIKSASPIQMYERLILVNIVLLQINEMGWHNAKMNVIFRVNLFDKQHGPCWLFAEELYTDAIGW